MSSPPWVSINYFPPLTIEETIEPETVSDPPPESKRSEKEKEDITVKKEVKRRQMRRLEKPEEGIAKCCGLL